MGRTNKTIGAWTALLLLLPCLSAFADVTLLKTDSNTFSFYGFLKTDATYQDFKTNSLVAPRYPLADTEANDDDSLNLTAMHSRFGFKWSGPALESGTQIKGTFEWDLFDTESRNQMKFRTRLAYLELKGEKYSLIAGQHWDLFGAGLPKTLITNGFYWQTGNTGFRRAQIRYTRFFESGELAFSMGDPGTNEAIYNAMPLLTGRYAFKFGEKKGGVLGIAATYGEEKFGNDSVEISGIGLDFKLPFGSQFSLMGEVAQGTNLRTYLSRSGTFTKASGKREGQEAMDGWLQMVYSAEKVEFYLGYAATFFSDDDEVAAGALGDSDAAFIGPTHKLGKGVSYGVEFTRFAGDYKGAEGGFDGSTANQLLFSILYAF
jgi:hypothetical protein